MAQRPHQSALLSRYLEQYRRQPSSRVFAPLAEAYRKLGMQDEALKVLKEGIKRHPSYPLGYLVLAQCYADQGQWERVAQTLLPLTPHHKDNVSMQRLYAQACLETGDHEAALPAFKWLLFLNPRDKTFAAQVAALEDELGAGHPIIPRESVRHAPETRSFGADDDDWTMVDLTPVGDAPVVAGAVENWEMRSEPQVAPGRAEDWQVMSRELDDEFFSDEEVSPENSEAPEGEGAEPLVSHTLVDLYLAQGQVEGAVDLLRKYLALNPRDEKSRNRLSELEARLAKGSAIPEGEEEGREALMRLVEAQVHSPDQRRVQQAFESFLHQLQVTARIRRGPHA